MQGRTLMPRKRKNFDVFLYYFLVAIVFSLNCFLDEYGLIVASCRVWTTRYSLLCLSWHHGYFKRM
jgi:hypothetical protein